MDLRECNILVTGAGGFIGSHLVEFLFKEKCKIRAFVHYNSFNRWGWLDFLDTKILSEIDLFTGDIRDYYCVKNAMKDIDVVFHLAALIAIPYSYKSPDSYIDTNIKGTINVLQAAREYKTKRVILTSTSEVYGSALYIPIDEKHPFQGQSPYSASKIGADRMGEAFHHSFDIPVTIVRPFNTYGPRQSARAVIPTIITQLISGKTCLKLGALYPTRDFVFVKDTVRGFIEIAKSDKSIGEEINIATQKEISIGDLGHLLINSINPSASIIEDDLRHRPHNSEVKRLLGSNEKIKRLTGWRPEYSIEEGIKHTIEWFKNSENLRFYKSDIYNV